MRGFRKDRSTREKETRILASTNMIIVHHDPVLGPKKSTFCTLSTTKNVHAMPTDI